MNPARLLHTRLSEWRDAHSGNASSVQNVRSLNSGVGWADQRLAMQDLIAVVAGLDRTDSGGHSMDTYRKYVDSWTSMVINFGGGWTNAIAQESAYPIGALDHLATLANWFDAMTPTLTADNAEALRAMLSRASSLLDEDVTITSKLKLYLKRLIREMEAALDDEELAERFDFEAATERLWVALGAAAEQSQAADQKARWSDLWRSFFRDVAAGAIASAPQIAIGMLGP